MCIQSVSVFQGETNCGLPEIFQIGVLPNDIIVRDYFRIYDYTI